MSKTPKYNAPLRVSKVCNIRQWRAILVGHIIMRLIIQRNRWCLIVFCHNYHVTGPRRTRVLNNPACDLLLLLHFIVYYVHIHLRMCVDL